MPQKVSGCDYKESTTNILHKISELELMAQVNLMGKKNKTEILNTKIGEAIDGK